MTTSKEKIVGAAQKFVAKGQFEKAIQEYQKLLKVEPNDIRTCLKIGDLYTRMGARKEATETYLKVAEQYTKNGFHLKAVAVYKQVLKIDPTLLDIHQCLADSYVRLGLTSEALIQLEQLADMFQRMDMSNRMLEVLARMADLDPQNIATRLRIAEHLSKEGQVREAALHFAGAADQLKAQGRIEDYIKVGERLLYHDAERIDLARELAQLYLERTQYKRALAKLQTCFVKQPRDLLVLEMLASAFRGLAQPEKAISVYKEMATILGEQGRDDEKRRILGLILELDPHNRTAMKQLSGGQAAGKSGAGWGSDPGGLPSPTGALAGAFEQAVDNEPAAVDGDFEERAAKIISEAEVLLKYGLKERAADHLKKVFEFDPYNIDVREKLKDVLVEMGNMGAALEELFFLAELFREQQPEGSVYYLHEVLRLDPSNARARKAILDLGGVLPDEIARAGTAAAPGRAQPEPATESEPGDGRDLGRVAGSVPADYEPTIDDIPYVAPERTFTEDDLEDAGIDVEDGGLASLEPELDENTASDSAAGGDLFGEEPDGENLPELEVLGPASLPAGDTFESPRPQNERSSFPAALGSATSTARLPRPATMSAPPSSPTASSFPSWPSVLGPSLRTAEVAEPSRRTSGRVSLPQPRNVVAPPRDRLPSVTPKPWTPPEERAAKRKSVPVPAPAKPKDAGADLPDIQSELDEIEFFLSERLYDEARTAIDDLSAKHPTDPRVMAAVVRLEELESAPKTTAPQPAESPVEPSPEEPEGSSADIETLPSKIKVNIDKQVAASDYSTHYDLGIAYKEMGLYEDAIREFESAAADPSRAALCKQMIGICYVGLERFGEAIDTLKAGLAIKGARRQEHMGLLYELGRTYELMGRTDEALVCFAKIQGREPGFADVASRIAALAGNSDSVIPKPGVFS
ncbi:MAG: tetratricopeptide repeat protein [Deltaproteobacteria bacterium]|nr:tetratricopeptide repeat protein [Deltaproteobacteria bacterium]